MKQMRLMVSLIFALCAFCLPAMAQRGGGGQRQWRYEGHNDEGYITIIITERQIGSALRYQVSGEYRSAFPCKISGSYFPAGERLRAVCEGKGRRQPMDITGRLMDGDVLSVQTTDAGGGVWATRVEGGPPLPTGGLTGAWRIVQTGGNGARYTGTLEFNQSGSQLTGRAIWDNHQSGAIKGTVEDKVVKFAVIYDGGLVGNYEGKRDESNAFQLGGTAYSNKGGGTVKWQAARQTK